VSAPLRVLYVNHTSRVSGAERSLLDLLGGLPGDAHAELACPPGDLADRAAARGVAVHAITGTDGSLKLHPRHTTQALVELARAAVQVRRLARRTGPSVIHANSIRAGMVCSMARADSPLAVHIRDRLPDGAASRASLELVSRGADVLIANSSYTADGLPPSAAARTRVVMNPVDLERFAPDAIDRDAARRMHGVDGPSLVLGVVAQVTPWKGQEEAIRTTASLLERGYDVRLLIVGATKFLAAGTRYDNAAYQQKLDGIVREGGIGDRVAFTGERDDIPHVLRALDVLLVPSWEEPFGRTVAEGMAMRLPVVATEVGGPAEIITPGEDGVLAPPKQPERWADAVAALLDDPERRARLGFAARARAERLALPEHVKAVLGVYAAVQSA
jgi:L-malate glycosyltransferase